jgi:hypothetical protein
MVKTQFMNRSSKAPPWRMPATPQLDTESTGTMHASWGGRAQARACCVLPA